MADPHTLGGRLKRARLQATLNRGEAMTQDEIAERLGVKGGTVSRYESGGSEPDLGTIVRLAAVLGVTPGWLAFGEVAGIVPVLGGEIRGDESPPADPPALPPAEYVPRPVPRPAKQPDKHRKRG